MSESQKKSNNTVPAIMFGIILIIFAGIIILSCYQWNRVDESNSDSTVSFEYVTVKKDDDSVSETTGLININTATAEELDRLPGIGAKKAEAIIEYRDNNGNFKIIDDIKKVSGIGNATFEQIKELITVE